MNHKGVLRFEQCFEEKEYEMVMQCCERQRHRRPKLTDVRARLIEMHENAGSVHIIFLFECVIRSDIIGHMSSGTI